MSAARLTVRSIRATPVEVPMRHVLGTSQAAVRAAPLLLVDLETEEGITGRAYLFCYVPAAAAGIVSILGEIERATKGERVAPLDAWKKLDDWLYARGHRHVFEMLGVRRAAQAAELLRKVAQATGLTKLDDKLEEFRATALIKGVLTRLGVPIA